MKSQHQLRVEQFMHRAGQEVPTEPTIPSEEVRLLRAKLILEEAFETIEALGVTVYYPCPEATEDVYFERLILKPSHDADLEQIADGCADISVVTIGALSACGIHDKELQEEVDRSNLDKFRGDAHRNPDGKWIKPSDWEPPNIAGVLERQTARRVRAEDSGVQYESKMTQCPNCKTPISDEVVRKLGYDKHRREVFRCPACSHTLTKLELVNAES